MYFGAAPCSAVNARSDAQMQTQTLDSHSLLTFLVDFNIYQSWVVLLIFLALYPYLGYKTVALNKIKYVCSMHMCTRI